MLDLLIKSLPDPRHAVRENGDSVIELVYNGQVVGEINCTIFWRGVFPQLDRPHTPAPAQTPAEQKAD